MESLQRKNIFYLWFFWHFAEMPKFLLEVWKNYILFALNYFSLPALAKSLFAPWRKYRWNYPRFFDVGEFLTTVISNMFSRLIGAFMRLILIVVGIFFQIFVLLAGVTVFLFWVVTPFIIIVGFWFAYGR